MFFFYIRDVKWWFIYIIMLLVIYNFLHSMYYVYMTGVGFIIYFDIDINNEVKKKLSKLQHNMIKHDNVKCTNLIS